MPLKLYAGNKIIYICEPGDTNQIADIPAGAISLNSLEDRQIASFFDTIQQSNVPAGVINCSQEEALNALKTHFTFIEAAGGLIVNDKDEILMIYRRGKWDLPKGKLDENETLEDCAVREVEEETGVKAHITGYLTTTYHTYVQDEEAILKISHWFTMKARNGSELQPQTEEDIESCEWVKQENIASYFEGAHASIRDVLSQGLK